MSAQERLPHATLDLDSRRSKGLKIEKLLGLAPSAEPLRLLEVGTGAGGIAHYFGTHPTLNCHVDAVDVHDNRQVRDGYRFQRVDGVDLPFPNQVFDVVISNHVIEHVGSRERQQAHLAEIRRVMALEGQGYVAVPNRWMLVEPHYHLAFLSWLPRRWRSRYLQLRGRGAFYDCEPLQLFELEQLIRAAGLVPENLGAAAVHALFDIEPPRSLVLRAAKRVPSGAWILLRSVMPTLIYRVRR